MNIQFNHERWEYIYRSITKRTLKKRYCWVSERRERADRSPSRMHLTGVAAPALNVDSTARHIFVLVFQDPLRTEPKFDAPGSIVEESEYKGEPFGSQVYTLFLVLRCNKCKRMYRRFQERIQIFF